MAFDYSIIIISLIFLIAMRLVIWIISNHRFQNLAFIGIYLIAISPNLVTVLSGSFTLDVFIMAFFDSIFIYILFSIYLGALAIMAFLKQGWVTEHIRTKRTQHPSDPETQAIMQTLQTDLKKLKEEE